MANYYVNLDLGKNSSGHAGTQLDPFSVADFIDKNHEYGHTYYFSGSYQETQENFNVGDRSTILPWYRNQPWRINTTNSTLFLARSFTLISGGILQLDKCDYPTGNSDSLITNCFIHLNSSNDWWSFECSLKGCSIYRSGSSTPHGVAFQSNVTDCVVCTGNSPLATNTYPTWTNCAFDHAQGFGDGVPTFVNCIANWGPPKPPPAWNAPHSAFDVSTLIGTLPTPPQPGNPPYTGYESFLWGTRTGIGTGYTLITSPDWVSTYPKILAVTSSKADFLVEINMAGTAYFVVVPSGSASPTSTQVKAGINGSGQLVATGHSGNVVLLQNVEGSLSATNLISGDYDVYFVAEGDSLQDAPTMLSFQVPVVTSPDWILTYPKTSIVRYTKADFLVEINMTGTAYFVALPSGSAAPTSAQVKAGTNSLDQPVKPGYSGSVALLENVESSLNATNLMSGNTYDVYFVAESESLQDVPVMLSIEVPKVEPINPEKPGHTFYNVVLAGKSEVDSSLPKVTSMFRNVILAKKKN